MLQRKIISFFKRADNELLLDPWVSTNRGTFGDGEFSNPKQLEKKGGFYGRGKHDKVDVHRIDTYNSIYVPTTHMPGAAAKFSFYGWVHHMLEPAIFVSVGRVHPYLPPLFDTILTDKISKEGELAGIHHIPWSDVSFSRMVICPFSFPIPIYLGEPVVNASFKCRNYSAEILSANSEEALQIYQQMKMLNAEDFKENERPITIEEAEAVNQALNEAANGYIVDKKSFSFRGSYTVPEGSSINQIIALRCEEYVNLMVANNTEKKVTYIFSNDRNILWSSPVNRQHKIDQIQEFSVSNNCENRK